MIENEWQYLFLKISTNVLSTATKGIKVIRLS